MRKKKVLVHGTAESLNKFFSDAVSRDYEIVALLSDKPDKISSDLEVFSPQNLPKVIHKLIDGIILTNATGAFVKLFLKQGIEPRKIILWDFEQGWGTFNLPDSDGTPVIYFCGLEFHIRNEEDVKFFSTMHEWIQQQRQIKNLDPKFYPAVLARQFQKYTGKPLDFNNLRTLTEKLQWLKIYDATPLKSRLADKYLVRNWIEEKIGGEYLIPLLGVWNDFDEINFDDLPDRFVLKCNHGWNMNIIVRDKKSLDLREAREKINAWLAVDFGTHNLQLHYSPIERKILAEKFMTNGDAPDIDNYKFWCFNGVPIFCGFDSGRTSDGDITNLRIDYFDMDWKPNEFENAAHPRSDHPERIPPPKNFELMKKLAAKLAEGFAFVRVDFYEIEGRIYFGEMTFTPGAGNFSYKSEGTDEYLGSLLKLPEPTPPPKL